MINQESWHRIRPIPVPSPQRLSEWTASTVIISTIIIMMLVLSPTVMWCRQVFLTEALRSPMEGLQRPFPSPKSSLCHLLSRRNRFKATKTRPWLLWYPSKTRAWTEVKFDRRNLKYHHMGRLTDPPATNNLSGFLCDGFQTQCSIAPFSLPSIFPFKTNCSHCILDVDGRLELWKFLEFSPPILVWCDDYRTSEITSSW